MSKADKPVDVAALKAQLAELQSQLDLALGAQRQEALTEAIRLVKEFGLKAHELGLSTHEKPVLKRAPAKIKYQNPANPRESWTGRGRMPKHIQALIESGQFTLEDLLVK